MRKDNRGLSLVEVVIVVTIMAVMGGLMAMAIGAAVTKPADECASKMASSLKEARITTMGKMSVSMEFYVQDDCIYMKEKILGEGTATDKVRKIGDKGVAVTYKLEGDSTYKALGGSTSALVLSFDRSSGAFKKCFEGTTDTGRYCSEIKVTKGDRQRTLKLYSLTGKVTVE